MVCLCLYLCMCVIARINTNSILAGMFQSHAQASSG